MNHNEIAWFMVHGSWFKPVHDDGIPNVFILRRAIGILFK